MAEVHKERTCNATQYYLPARPSLVGRRHECAPPRKSRRSTPHTSCTVPGKSGPRLCWEGGVLLYLGSIKPSFRTFPWFLFVLDLPLSIPVFLFHSTFYQQLLPRPHRLRTRCRALNYDSVEFSPFRTPLFFAIVAVRSVAGRTTFAFGFPSFSPSTHLARRILVPTALAYIKPLASPRQRQAIVAHIFSLSLSLSLSLFVCVPLFSPNS